MDRMDRINELIHAKLAESINRLVVVPGAMLTITDVTTTPDLKFTHIKVSVLPDKFYGQALEALRRANPVLRSHLTKSVKIKFIPKLIWHIDSGPKYAASLDHLFDEISQDPR